MSCKTFQTSYFQSVWLLKTDAVRSQWWELHNTELKFCLPVFYRSTKCTKTEGDIQNMWRKNMHKNVWRTASITDSMWEIQTLRTVQCDYLLTDCSSTNSTFLLIQWSQWTRALVSSAGNLHTCNIQKYGTICRAVLLQSRHMMTLMIHLLYCETHNSRNIISFYSTVTKGTIIYWQCKHA